MKGEPFYMIVVKSMNNNDKAKILSAKMEAAADLEHWQLDMNAEVSGGNMVNLSA